MTYTERKERSHRFALALRMGLPIFLLTTLTLFSLLNQWTQTLFESFALLSISLLAVIVYFIFYLIYQSVRENITDPVTHTFTQEYFVTQLEKVRREKTVSLILLTVGNLAGINERYGMKNGNVVLRQSVSQINQFFASRKFDKLPVCRIKGGDFLIYVEGEKEEIAPLLELFLAKYANALVNEIEVEYEGVLIDTRFNTSFEEMTERLYEFLNHQRDNRAIRGDDEPEGSEMQQQVLEAFEAKRYSLALQKVAGGRDEICEVSVKLVDGQGSFIHQSRYVPILNREGKMRGFESDILERVVELAASQNRTFVLSATPAVIRNGHFFQFALELLQYRPEAKGKIVFMIGEKEYCPKIRRFAEQISQYRAVGFQIALDRLGGYHTTMMYLRELQVDIARFDPLYARHIREEGYRHLLKGLNTAARLCGVRTWIPMIEDEEADRIAREAGIDYRQGNFIGKIAPLNDNEHEKGEL